jgi:cyanophycin synthetase
MDLAHNEAGLEALVEVLKGVRAPGARTHLGLGAVGDRQDELLVKLGEIAARDVDVVAIGHKQRYLRGRTTGDLDRLLREGAARVGVTDVPSYPTELAALQILVDQARPGDVVGLMCHAEREDVLAWLDEQGAVADTPEVLREKVRRNGG